MSQEEVEILKRALKREKAARKAAEKILEDKSRILYETSLKLKESNTQLEQHLIEKSSQLQGVFENIVDAYVIMDLEGNVIKFNDAATNLFGYNIDKEPLNVVNLIYRKDYEYAMSSFANLKTKGFFKNYQARVYTKSKEVKWVHINASIIFDGFKKPIGAQGIVRDITDEKTLKKQLEDQKNQLSIIINNSPIGISLSKRDKKGLLLVNNSLCNMLGYSANEFNNLQIQDITHPEDQEISQINREKLYNGEIDNFNLEKRYVRKDGSILWAKTNVIAVRNDHGEIDYQVATIEDVSKEHEAKEKLIESENRLSTLILNLDSGIVLEDENRKIVLVNKKFCDLFNINHDPSTLIGMDCKKVSEQNMTLFKDPEAFIQRMHFIDNEKKLVIGDELEMLDGKILERNYMPISTGYKSQGFLWTFTDVTLKRTYRKRGSK